MCRHAGRLVTSSRPSVWKCECERLFLFVGFRHFVLHVWRTLQETVWQDIFINTHLQQWGHLSLDRKIPLWSKITVKNWTSVTGWLCWFNSDQLWSRINTHSFQKSSASHKIHTGLDDWDALWWFGSNGTQTQNPPGKPPGILPLHFLLTPHTSPPPLPQRVTQHGKFSWRVVWWTQHNKPRVSTFQHIS